MIFFKATKYKILELFIDKVFSKLACNLNIGDKIDSFFIGQKFKEISTGDCTLTGCTVLGYNKDVRPFSGIGAGRLYIGFDMVDKKGFYKTAGEAVIVDPDDWIFIKY